MDADLRHRPDRRWAAPIMQEMNAPAKENETKEIADQSFSEKAVNGDQG